MQKKLLAVAVAGALAAPVAAMAQSSVTVSGAVNIWYETAGASGATTAGNATTTTFDVKSRDRMQDGNGSNIRFTAVEDIGSGLQGFMQVESAVINNANTRNDAAGAGTAVSTLQNAGGWGTRNSGVGLRGQAWGEVLIGIWDMHYNEQYPADAQIIKGASHNSVLALMNSFGLGGSSTSAGGVGSVSIGARYSNVIRYQSPNWSGFNFKLAYARPTDSANVSTTVGAPTEGKKNTAINFAPQFNMGGIHVGLSYIKDSDIVTNQTTWYTGSTVTNQAGVAAGAGPVIGNTIGSAAAGSNLTTITSTRLFGAYTFPFGLKIGLVYDQSKLDLKSSGTAATSFASSQFKRSVWGIPIVYTIGAHTIGAGYAQSSKLTGSVGQANGTTVGLSDVGVTTAAVVIPAMIASGKFQGGITAPVPRGM